MRGHGGPEVLGCRRLVDKKCGGEKCFEVH